MTTHAPAAADPIAAAPRRRRVPPAAVAERLWALTPGGLTLYLGFHAGGYFADGTGIVTVVVALLLAGRLLIARRLARSFPPLLGVAVAAGGAYAAWTLASGAWSDAPGRAMLAYDRALLYVLTVALGTVVAADRTQRRVLIRGLAAALAIICGAGLISRVLPHLLPVAGSFENGRLSYPVTYWNVLGLTAALAIVLCLHIGSDPEEPVGSRIVFLGLVPALAATLLLTYSRGSIAAVIVGVAAYLAARRVWGALLPMLCAAPFTWLALRFAYDAHHLASAAPTTPAAVAQGRTVALVLALAIAGTMVLAFAVIEVARRRLVVVDLPPQAGGIATVVAVLCACVIVVIAHVPRWVDHQYRSFVHGTVVPAGPTRQRLASGANNGRIELWRVALVGFRSNVWHGQGAGTYSVLWERDRRLFFPAQNAHSLYLENLAELGLVGTALLVTFLGALLLAAVLARRRPERRGAAALAIALLLAWLLHAAVDWDWQMPVAGLPVLALAGSVAARRGEPWGARGPVLRAGAALVIVLSAVLAMLMTISQAELNSSVAAFRVGHWGTSLSRARAAHAALGARPEPLEMIGYAELRRREPAAAVSAMHQAVTRDPRDWEFRYALAVALAAAGRNPRPQLRYARALDPHEPLVLGALARFGAAPHRRWPRVAAALPSDIAG